ncbi:VanZ family protein [Ancrocorticia sp.]|uniref:VanZ family protein n=1 Tax=Ancrocorticia sp. TaxID=2593684 RepID=UPI003F907565
MRTGAIVVVGKMGGSSMAVWLDNAEISMYLGIAAFVVLMIPGLILQYVKYGQFTARRMLGWLAVCVYGTALVVYTFMPLPTNPAAFCAEHAASANTTPFAFVSDIRRQTAGLTLTQAARSTVVLQVVFNIILFVPFGAILRRYFGRGVVLTTTAGFLTSLAIESLQYTGLLGLYPCAIRVADVDDVMTNTFGALVGALLAPAFLWWMPSAARAAEKRLQPRKVTVWRRWTGMMIDAALFLVLSAGVTVTLGFIQFVVDGEASAQPPSWHATVSVLIPLLVVFVLPAAGGRGASAGQKIVWLTPKWLSEDGRTLTDSNPVMRILRALVVVGPWVLTDFLADSSTAKGIVGLISTIVLFLAVVMVPFSANHRSFSGWITRATFVDSREPVAGGPENGAPEPLTGAKKRELRLA